MIAKLKALPWALWIHQILAVVRLELRKSLLQRKAWWLLAIGPVLLTGGHSILASRESWIGDCSLGVDTRAFASIFQFYILRIGIFFGCAGIFMSAFRGEVAEKTLHYYFLTPMRREVLTIGKFMAGEITALLFFTGGTALSYVLVTLHFGTSHWERLLRGAGLYELGWYVIVASLACLGYGALFTLMGLWYKNPMIPAAAVMVWEGMNPFLPTMMKKVSVIFYLKGLCPVEVPMNGALAQIEVLADPTPALFAIPGLLLLATILLALAAWSVRQMEVSYGE